LASVGLLLALAAAAEEPGDARSLAPPAVFSPVACSTPPFPDVPIGNPFCPFIRELSQDQITAGCGGGNYCPDAPVTRGQLAAYLEKVMRGTPSWDAWRDGPVSPSGINWGSVTGTSSVGTMLEYTLETALDDDGGIYFDGDTAILWSPGDGGLLRIFDEDAADSSPSDPTPAEFYNFGQTALSLRNGGSNGNFTIGFRDDGNNDDEFIRWRNDTDRFELSNDLLLPGVELGNFGTITSHVRATGVLLIGIDSDSNSTGASLEVVTNTFGVDVVALARFNEADGSLDVNGAVNPNAFDLAESYVRAEAVAPGDVVRAEPGRSHAVRRAVMGDGGAILGVVSTAPGVQLGGKLLDDSSFRVWPAEVRQLFAAQAQSLRGEVLARRPELAVQLARASAQRAVALAGAEPEERGRVERETAAAVAAAEREIHSRALERFAERTFAPVALAGRVPVKVDAAFGAVRVGDPLAASPIPGVAMRAREPGPVLGTALEPLAAGRGRVLMFVDRGWWGGREPSASGQEREVAIAEREPIAEIVDEGAEEAAVDAGDGLTLRAHGAGHAELLPAAGDVRPGEVVVLDGEHPGAVRTAAVADDRAVAGVAGETPGVLAGRGSRDAVPVVVAGTARVWADAGYGAIDVGDLLVTSPTSGHAMRADRPDPGTVLGKAMQRLEAGTGLIRVLVTLQ
jgi:hypothetical protein